MLKKILLSLILLLITDRDHDEQILFITFRENSNHLAVIEAIRKASLLHFQTDLLINDKASFHLSDQKKDTLCQETPILFNQKRLFLCAEKTKQASAFFVQLKATIDSPSLRAFCHQEPQCQWKDPGYTRD